MEYLGIAILLIATIAVVALPVIKADTTGEEPQVFDLTLAKLEEDKESAYNALKEAEFDYKTGKLSDEDYEAVTTKYRQKAMEALQKLEEHEKQSGVLPAGRHGGSQGSAAEQVDKKATNGLKAASGKKQEANFCGNCGEQIYKGSKFCPSCGQRLN